ncbi:MAG: hypothetical protein JXA69_11115 [Phycisphaerae bacterium]|nr:hypothetical protein [Phycisphaerae bacterium]
MYLDLSASLPQKLLAEENGLLTIQDRSGYTIRKFAGKSRSLEFIDHVTKDRTAWETLAPHFTVDPQGPARIDDASYFCHMDPYPAWQEARRKYDALRQRSKYLLFQAYGPWEGTWRHRGLTELLMDIAIDPDWVREMIHVHVSLLIDTLSHCITLGMTPDGLFLIDDFGSTKALLFSPAMWRDILQPEYERLSRFLRGHAISFWLHSCGNVSELIPHLIDSGLDVLQAIQVNAGMDIRELIPKYGKKLVFYGNISATTMSGPIEAVEEEIRSKLTFARENGGRYIYHSDHSIPPEVTFDRYCRVMDMVGKYGAA